MKIFAALKQIEFVLKLFAAAGFTNFAAALESKNENALKDFISSQAKVEKLVEKVIEPTDEQIQGLVSAELREQIAAAGITLKADTDPVAALKDGLATYSALLARNTLVEEQLAALGIKFVAADAKVGLTAADITKAVSDRVSLKAAELTAQLGTKPVTTQVVASPAAAPGEAAKSQLTGLAKVQAAFESDRK